MGLCVASTITAVGWCKWSKHSHFIQYSMSILCQTKNDFHYINVYEMCVCVCMWGNGAMGHMERIEQTLKRHIHFNTRTIYSFTFSSCVILQLFFLYFSSKEWDRAWNQTSFAHTRNPSNLDTTLRCFSFHFISFFFFLARVDLKHWTHTYIVTKTVQCPKMLNWNL